MTILLGLWRRDEEFSFSGKHFTFPPTYPSPRPLQAPHPPLSLAARSPESLRFCLRNGFAIHTTPLRQPKSASRTTMSTIAAIAAEMSDIAPPEVAIEIETFVSENAAIVMDAMRHLEASHIRTQNFGRHGRMPVKGFGGLEPLPEGLQISAETLAERCVTGDPAAVLEQVREFQDMGMSEFIANMDFGQPQRDILKSIESFGAKVIARDWTPRVPNPFVAGGGRDQEARREALARTCEARFGPHWRDWRENEWIGYFEARERAGEPTHEIFDLSLYPTNVRAEATGIVTPRGKLAITRDLPCPGCGRPTLVLSYRPNGESPQTLRERAAASPAWSTWHGGHP